MNINSLKPYLVEENGTVNIEKSLGRLEADLLRYQHHKTNCYTLVEVAINQLFDTYHGASISMQALISMSLTEIIKATPDNWKMLETTLMEYLNSNTGERGKSRFGKAGGRGYWRWSDYVTPVNGYRPNNR